MKRAHGVLAAVLVGVSAQAASGCDGNVNSKRSSEPIASNGDASNTGARNDGGGTQGSPEGGDSQVGTPGTPGTPGAGGCKPLVREAGVDYGGLRSDKYSWYDRECKLRTAGLVQSDAPGGGGFARGFTYETGGRTRNALGTNAGNWNGFGYLVNHGEPTTTSQGRPTTARVVLAGAHHAIHEFKTRMSMAGPVDVTVHWFFATGRSHPIFAITHDATPAGPGVVSSDSRSPYGDIAWDEGPGSDGNVSGVAWGDKFQFTSTGEGPLTPASAWDYTKPNTIPYAMEWADRADAEMGLVQTQTFEQLPAGGDYGNGVLEGNCWGRTSATKGGSCSSGGWNMPSNWLWPMQLNQYELPFATNSHRLAWGTSYGAVGAAQYMAFGKRLSGYPFHSYSLAIVLGTHSGKAVETQRIEFEVIHASRLSATRGTVVLNGPAGVGRTDSATYAPAGYNHVYGTWELQAAGNAVTAEWTVGSGTLSQPIVRVREFTAAAPKSVRVAGTELVAGEGYFATVDAATQTLWLTINQALNGTVSLEID